MHRSIEAPPARLRARQILLTVPFWLALAFLVQATLPWHFDRVIWGTQGMDGRFNLWVLSWVYHALTAPPLRSSGPGPAGLQSTVTCDWDSRAPRQWVQEAGLQLAGDLRTGEEATEGLGARYLGHDVPSAACAGCPIVIRLEARNTGSLVWTRAGLVRLGLLWTTEAGRVALEWRVSLPRDVYPGQMVPIVAPIPTPRTPGRYRLTVDLLQEGKTWFMSRGVTPVVATITLS